MNFVEQCNLIFAQAVKDYHRTDNVDAPISNPYTTGTIEYYLYLKNWIDTVQWNARINTESPAWAIDRLSILHVKLWHMQEQVDRTDVSQEQHDKCVAKMAVLKEQLEDMTTSISQLLADYADGTRIMKVYRQMKMYNDPTLNPVLYGKK